MNDVQQTPSESQNDDELIQSPRQSIELLLYIAATQTSLRPNSPASLIDPL